MFGFGKKKEQKDPLDGVEGVQVVEHEPMDVPDVPDSPRSLPPSLHVKEPGTEKKSSFVRKASRAALDAGRTLGRKASDLAQETGKFVRKASKATMLAAKKVAEAPSKLPTGISSFNVPVAMEYQVKKEREEKLRAAGIEPGEEKGGESGASDPALVAEAVERSLAAGK